MNWIHQPPTGRPRDPGSPGLPAPPPPGSEFRPLALHRERREWRRLLPDFVPVALLAPLVAFFIGTLVNDAPIALIFLLPPTALLLGSIMWLDRLEPEPSDARVFAFLWGSIVAVTLGAASNEVVTYHHGLFAGLVISAPIAEEIAKGLVFVSLARHRLVNSPLDGALYAFWSAAGFALVEDLLYFADAFALEGVGGLLTVAVARGLVTPFAHPLFSVWIGLAVGYAINGFHPSRAPSRHGWAGILAGLIVAIGLHATWNGAFYFGESQPEIIVVIVPSFMALFAVTAAMLVRLRQQQMRTFEQSVWWLTARFGLTPAEQQLFQDAKTYLAVRKAMRWDSRQHLARMRWSMHQVARIHARQRFEPGWRAGDLPGLERDVRDSRAALYRLANSSGGQR